MKKILLLGLVFLLFSSTIIYAAAESEIIYPRMEIVNKTQSNSVEVTEDLPDLPKQKISEVTLKSNDFTIFKQKQAGDYVQLTIVTFENNKFLSNFYKMMLSFHSATSAEFAFYDLNNKLVLRDITIAKDREEKIDLTMDGNDDIVLSYLGYDVNDLPAFKVKAYLPEGTLYYKGHYCELAENKDKYTCYKENAETGEVSETYEISAADLQLAGSTIEQEVQDIVRKEAIEQKNADINQSVTDEMNKSQIGEQGVNIPWDKVVIILAILVVIVLGYMKHKSIKKNKAKNDDFGGDF